VEREKIARSSSKKKREMTFLEVKNLSKSFGGLQVLSKIDFDLDPREILGLIGPNGSGKTTLFNLITGFLKPNAGRILFKGKEITKLANHRVCQAGISRTFQLVKPFAHMTALQNVMVGRMYGRKPAQNLREARKEAEEILESTGLGAKKFKVAQSLTLSDRKRLELAKALATKPELLLVDEMMAGLNLAETEEAITMIKNIRDSGITMMVVEHVMSAVLEISDRIMVLNAGEKIAEGAPDQIMENKQVIEAYLGKESYARD
jgi:branched-chain amino acid transport system ATP-binding protein